ncbi:MAG: response regulator [Proteobacteria bacterium]|nr:response regulator [Pseudomonadota bacterium]
MSIDKNIQILVVEDDDINRTLLVKILDNIGFRKVTEAENGISAWEKLQSAHFDLILTDWMMPEMDGLELLKKIRASTEELSEIPVMFITALGRPENIKEVATLGISGYVIKPFSVNTVFEKIVKAME